MLKANRILKQLTHKDRLHNRLLDIRPKDIILGLKEHEVDAVKILGIDLDDFIYEKINPKISPAKIKLLRHSNSYNNNSEVTFQYLNYIINSKEYVAVAFHIAGDVRCNYTDFMLLELDINTFLNIVYEYSLVFFVMNIDNKYVALSTNALNESGVFTIDTESGNRDVDIYLGEIDTTIRNRKLLTKQIKSTSDYIKLRELINE